MKKEEILQNVIAIAEKGQRAGIFTLQETPIILQTIKELTELLNDEVIE